MDIVCRKHHGIIGRIRPGIRVLKRSVANNPEANRIYDEGVCAGAGFQAIEKALYDRGIKNALIPQNAPYFSVWSKEFKNQTSARRILELYGEDRDGGTEPHLYEFPVYFSTSDPRSMIISGMESYTATEMKFHSEETTQGVMCIEKAPMRKGHDGQVMRMWRGRKEVVRKPCDPENCREFLNRECNERHHIVVGIPGAIGATEYVEIPTGSYFSVSQIREQLDHVASVCGGQIPTQVQLGYKDKPIFWLKKIEQNIAYTDYENDGKKRKTKQFLCRLEVDIGMAQLVHLAQECAFRARSASLALLPKSAQQAALAHQPEEAWITSLKQQNVTLHGEVIPAAEPEPAIADNHVAAKRPAEQATQQEQPSQPSTAEVATLAHPSAQTAQPTANIGELQTLRKQIRRACANAGIQFEHHFVKYGNIRFGMNWGSNPSFLNAAINEVEQAVQSGDLEGYEAEMSNVMADIPHVSAAITNAPAETPGTFLHPAVQEKEMASAVDKALDNRTPGAEEKYVAVVQRDSITASGEQEARPTEREMIASLRKTAVGLCNQIGVDATLFAVYATDKFGDGWGARMDSLKFAIAELEDVITQDYAEQYADDLKSIVEDLRENA